MISETSDPKFRFFKSNPLARLLTSRRAAKEGELTPRLVMKREQVDKAEMERDAIVSTESEQDSEMDELEGLDDRDSASTTRDRK